MKRRQFNQMIAGAMAAMPFGGLARAAAPAASGKTYVWAVSRAMSKGSISAEAMVTELGMSPRAARAHLARMIQRGVVTAPNAAGTARVVSPVLQGTARVQLASAVATQTTRAQSGTNPLRSAVQKLKSVIPDTASDPVAPEPEPTDPDVTLCGDDPAQPEASDAER